MAAKSDGFKDFVLDQLTNMFGGYGLYHRSQFFGIIHKGQLYFKVSAATLPVFRAHGMKPFRPNVKQTLTSFYEVPIHVVEDHEQLTAWAEQGKPDFCSTPYWSRHGFITDHPLFSTPHQINIGFSSRSHRSPPIMTSRFPLHHNVK